MATKRELLAQEVAKAVGAGKTVAMETVDFNDPNRPKTCLEVDFPILPVNQVAIIEGNAGKPIYQMSKWWARRRSSVFRSMLIAAATKAPEDKSHAAKLVWDNYYANHQKKGAFKHLKVADIFMGGGTTLVEGSRLGMQMVGNDLNPVAWFVVKQELANVDLEEVKKLLADIEAEVKPQIMPYYFYMCDMIPNSEHWRLSVAEAQALQHDIMGYMPGYATPRLLCDVPFVGKRWVHQVSEYDLEKGISYWTKNYRTSIELENAEALDTRYAYYDPLYTLPESGKRWWAENENAPSLEDIPAVAAP